MAVANIATVVEVVLATLRSAFDNILESQQISLDFLNEEASRYLSRRQPQWRLSLNINLPLVWGRV